MARGFTADTQFVGNRAGDEIEADYSFSYQNHAPKEVLAAPVRWTP